MKPRTLSAIGACALLTEFAAVLFGRPLIARPKEPGREATPAFRVVEAECDSAHGIKIGVANATSKPLPETFQLTVKGYTKNGAFIMERSNGVAHRGMPVAPAAPVLWPGEEFSFQWPLTMLSDSAGNSPAYIQVNILPWIVVKGAGVASVALDRDHPAKIIGDSKIACVAPAASASKATAEPLPASKKTEATDHAERPYKTNIASIAFFPEDSHTRGLVNLSRLAPHAKERTVFSPAETILCRVILDVPLPPKSTIPVYLVGPDGNVIGKGPSAVIRPQSADHNVVDSHGLPITDPAARAAALKAWRKTYFIRISPRGGRYVRDPDGEYRFAPNKGIYTLKFYFTKSYYRASATEYLTQRQFDIESGH